MAITGFMVDCDESMDSSIRAVSLYLIENRECFGPKYTREEGICAGIEKVKGKEYWPGRASPRGKAWMMERESRITLSPV